MFDQERVRMGQWVTRVRVCNYVKNEAGQNFLPVLKIVTQTAHDS